MVSTRKISQMLGPQAFQLGDVVAGLHSGANYQLNGFNGGGGGQSTFIITQPPGGPVLTPGQVVRIGVTGVDAIPGAYYEASSVDAHQAEAVGVVLATGPGVNQYTLIEAGYISNTVGMPAFPNFAGNIGVPYYLDFNVAGNIVNTDAGAPISRPIFIPDTATSGVVVLLERGEIIGVSSTPGGGGTPSGIFHTIPGTFQIGQFVYPSADNVYSLTNPNTFMPSNAIGVVISSSGGTSVVQFSGWNQGSIIHAVDGLGNPIPITVPNLYYLSNVVPGAITPIVPTTGYSKPVYEPESVVNQSGWVLPQRSLSATAGNPNSSPYVFLGQLNAGNNFSSQTILQDTNGNTYGAYSLIIQPFTLNGGLGINGQGAGNVGIGFQIYINGAWQTAFGSYANLVGGVTAPTNTHIATQWAFQASGGIVGSDSMVLLPRTSINVGLTSGTITLINRSGAQVMNFNTATHDYTNLPASQTNYSSIGYGASSTIGVATGLRVYFDNGVLQGGSPSYISVYGIPNS